MGNSSGTPAEVWEADGVTRHAWGEKAALGTQMLVVRICRMLFDVGQVGTPVTEIESEVEIYQKQA